jgi:hypothetical protein
VGTVQHEPQRPRPAPFRAERSERWAEPLPPARWLLVAVLLRPHAIHASEDWCFDDPVLLIGLHALRSNLGVQGTAAQIATAVSSAEITVYVPQGVPATLSLGNSLLSPEHLRIVPVPGGSLLGGDEFTVLAADLPSGEEAMRIAARIVERLAQPDERSEPACMIGASVDVAHTGDAAIGAGQRLDRADRALYTAKAARYSTRKGQRRRRCRRSPLCRLSRRPDRRRHAFGVASGECGETDVVN